MIVSVRCHFQGAITSCNRIRYLLKRRGEDAHLRSRSRPDSSNWCCHSSFFFNDLSHGHVFAVSDEYRRKDSCISSSILRRAHSCSPPSSCLFLSDQVRIRARLLFPRILPHLPVGLVTSTKRQIGINMLSPNRVRLYR